MEISQNDIQDKKITLTQFNQIFIVSPVYFTHYITDYLQVDFPKELSNIILSFITICTEEDENIQDVIHCIQSEQDECLQYEDSYIFQDQQYEQMLLHDNGLCTETSSCSQCFINIWQAWNDNCNV